MDERELLADGLHPNDAGHQFIAEAVEPKLREALSLERNQAA
jgi:lysophospholipase L1-like esterase